MELFLIIIFLITAAFFVFGLIDGSPVVALLALFFMLFGFALLCVFNNLSEQEVEALIIKVAMFILGGIVGYILAERKNGNKTEVL